MCRLWRVTLTALTASMSLRTAIEPSLNSLDQSKTSGRRTDIAHNGSVDRNTQHHERLENEMARYEIANRVTSEVTVIEAGSAEQAWRRFVDDFDYSTAPGNLSVTDITTMRLAPLT